jgi:hypothetical protein
MIRKYLKKITTWLAVWLWNTAFVQALVANELREAKQPEGDA